MSNAVINFNTDAKVKRELVKTVNEMGLTVSIALNHAIRKIIADKRIEFATPETPNARLRKAMKETEEEIKSGKLKFYTNHEDFEKALFS